MRQVFIGRRTGGETGVFVGEWEVRGKKETTRI